MLSLNLQSLTADRKVFKKRICSCTDTCNRNSPQTHKTRKGSRRFSLTSTNEPRADDESLKGRLLRLDLQMLCEEQMSSLKGWA